MPLLQLLQRAAPVRLTGGSQGQDLVPIAQWQNAMFGTWPGYENYPWAYVTEEEALGLPVVGGFISITSSLLLQMPLHAYQSPAGTEVQVIPAPDIISNPTPGPSRTFGDFINEYLRDMLLYGNYVAILGPRNQFGYPDVMLTVPAGQWQIVVSGDGLSYTYLINGRTYTPDRIFHVTMNATSGDLVGRGILNLYKRLIAASVAAERWAAMYFDGGAVPPGVLTSANPELTQLQADQLKAKMKAVAMAREWAVVPAGTDLEVLDGNAEEAQLNETRTKNNQELAMALGIPGALLGMDAPSLTYRNITDVFQQFITTTLMSYLVPLEQQLSLQCLPVGTEARFHQANVLRPDLAARVELANACMTSGLFTKDESRVFFDLAAVHAIQKEQTPEVVL
jgi:HK97 family phage portal protein